MVDIKRAFKRMKGLYKVNDVRTGYDYWYFKLLNLLLQMFEYKGLPESLPAREIELNLLLTGHCCIFPRKNGKVFAPKSNIFGYDEYYQPTWAIFANPRIISWKRWRIGTDCSIIYNSSLKDSIWTLKSPAGLDTLIQRYARDLADLEATLNIYTVNSRLLSIPATDDDTVANSVDVFYKELDAGERSILTDSAIIERFRNIDINRTGIKDGVNDWLIARDKKLEQFYRDIGLKMYNPKKAQVTEEELESNNQILLIAADDMLKCRQEGLEQFNDMFGFSASVKVSKLFNVKEVENNDVQGSQSREVSA